MGRTLKSTLIHEDTKETNMSLDSTSHPGRPGPDELVPSRYALRVGEIDVLVVSDGALSLPAVSMATNADPAVHAAWLDHMFLPRDAFDWPLNAVVVRSGGHTILIDAGLGGSTRTFRGPGIWPCDCKPPASILPP